MERRLLIRWMSAGESEPKARCMAALSAINNQLHQADQESHDDSEVLKNTV